MTPEQRAEQLRNAIKALTWTIFDGEASSLILECLSATLRERDAEHEEALADAERRLGMLRALLAAERKEIEYLRGQVKALNGALGR